ncbi:MAG: DUF4080 domain-containing protein [Bacteroidetes bacterium]|nr:DUF4080 domain-containing protein [Bacteroidota bacterium]
MILLWLDINTSFAHSSLALPALHAQVTSKEWQWHIVSGKLHAPYADYIQRAIGLQPDVIAATAWLFNHEYLLALVSRIKALCPHTYVILGGPEFLGNNEAYLRRHPYVNAVFRGEGEEIFPQWLQLWDHPQKRGRLTGICTIDNQGVYRDGGKAKATSLEALIPPENSLFFPFNKPFVQLETTRGCYNNCSFCVSGGDKPLRSLSVHQIRIRLKNMEAKGVRKIRMLDRTFNENPKRSLALLRLFEEFAGSLHFHVEIHPGILTREVKTLMTTLPKGLLHVEAGVQSFDDQVLEASGRTGNSTSLLEGLTFLCSAPNFETHTDLIAGLPYYTLLRLKEDIHTLIALNPDEIQLELLKLLPGTSMREGAFNWGITYAPLPPYEVLSTPAMPPQDVREAQQLSRLLDGWYNHSHWNFPFKELVLREPAFLDDFLTELMHRGLLDQPLSMERRGLLLYEFCRTHYPHYLPQISQTWIEAGYSPKKAPGQYAIKQKNI